MSTATGTPVFVTVGGDASAATVTYTASGATTSATVTLSDLAASVEAADTEAATANAAAASAVTTATAAQSTANSASTTATSALSVANAAVPASSANVANGYAALNSLGDLALAGSVVLGETGKPNYHILEFFTNPPGTQSANYDSGFMAVASTGTGSQDGRLMFVGDSFEPLNDNQTQIGSASNRVTQIFSVASALNTSDVKQKKDIVSLVDTDGLAKAQGAAVADDEATKLLQVGRDIPIAVFTMNTGTRRHVGTLAQAVQAAFTAQGLDAANYGMWGEDKLYDLVAVNSEKTETYIEDGETKTRTVTVTTYENQPRMKDGVQEALQSVRLDQVCALKLAALQYDLDALSAKTTLAASTPSTAD